MNDKKREWASGLGPAWKTGRERGREREQCGGEGGVSQTNLFNEKCEERGAWVAFAWDIRKKCMHTQRILSLMISLLACTQTYKNNTALISTWHDVIITVLQMFKNKRIQTNTRKNSKIRHDDGTSASHMKNQPFPPAWNEARPETQVGPKKSALFHSFFSFFFLLFFFSFLFFYRKKIISMCTPIRQQAPYVINVMTIASQITAQPCNSLLCYNDLTIKCIIPLSNKIRKTALQKRKCPKISSSSASIYISICIYTYTQSQRYTRLCWKTSCFFHKVIHTLGHHHLEHIFIQ